MSPEIKTENENMRDPKKILTETNFSINYFRVIRHIAAIHKCLHSKPYTGL
jgi:hypothetical protein